MVDGFLGESPTREANNVAEEKAYRWVHLLTMMKHVFFSPVIRQWNRRLCLTTVDWYGERKLPRILQPSYWPGIWASQGLISRGPHSSVLMRLWVGFMCTQNVIQRTPKVPWHVSPNGTAQYMEVRFCNSEHLRGSKKKERFLKLCPRSDFPTSSTFSRLEGSHYVCFMLNGWELHKDMKTRS